jgi:hypothetical protein
MYNSLTRIQNTFGFFTTVAFTLGCFIAATDLFAVRNPSGVLSTNNVQVYVRSPCSTPTRVGITSTAAS